MKTSPYSSLIVPILVLKLEHIGSSVYCIKPGHSAVLETIKLMVEADSQKRNCNSTELIEV